jgi:transcription antitermination factor NusG
MERDQQRVEQWFALRVKGRSEKAISNVLADKGYTAFLPVYPSRSWRSSGPGRVELPLFPGYVFCRFDVNRRLPILKTPGVLYIVSVGRAPATVDDREIVSLQKAVEHRLVTGPSEFLQVGTKVRIVEGSLSGVEGILLEFKNSVQLILSISLLCRSVRVEVPRDCVVAGSAPALRYSKEPAIPA